MEAYNDYLFHQRKKAGLRRREVCKRLGVSKFLYHRFERGYSVPKGEVIDRIDELYGGDFRQYLKGEPSYPQEIRSKGEKKLKKALSKAFSHIWIRILAIVLPIVGLSSIPAALIVENYNSPIELSYYSQTYEDIQRYSAQVGQPYVDPLGNFNKKINSFVFDDSGSALYTAVMAPNDINSIFDMQFLCIIRNSNEDAQDYRYRLSMLIDKGNHFEFMVVDNETGEYIVQNGRRISSTEYEPISSEEYMIDAEHAKDFEVYTPDFAFFAVDLAFTLFFNDFDDHNCFGPDGLDISDIYEQVWAVKAQGDAKYESLNRVYSYLSYLGAPLGILFTVISILAFTFLRAKGVEELPIERGEVELPGNRRLPLYMGASAIRILGSLMFLIGSTYVLLSIANNFGLISMVISFMDEKAVLALSLNMFFLGVFFLYILGLADDFGHPKRLYLRTIVVGGIALGVSVLQSLFHLQMSFYENGFVDSVLSYMPSNIFVPIFMFHLTALFLFSKPVFVKLSWIRVWRWLSILPVMFSMGVYIVDLLSNLNVIADVGPLSYFLGNNRSGFTLVTYSFLFGNYFIRRYYRKKYGSAYLRGDMYAFHKNLTLCVPALVVGLIELVLYFVPGARVFGFGDSISLLLVAIVMFFYRGHNDKNHLLAMIFSVVIYVVGLIVAYAATVAAVLFYLSLM